MKEWLPVLPLALIACVAAGLTLLKMEPAVKNRSEKPVIGLEYMWLYVDFDKAAERAVYIIYGKVIDCIYGKRVF